MDTERTLWELQWFERELNEFLDKLRGTLLQRGAMYGFFWKLHERIGRAWAERGGLDGESINVADVLRMLADVKRCREIGQHVSDNILDEIGYLVLAHLADRFPAALQAWEDSQK